MKHEIWFDADTEIVFLDYKSDFLTSDVPEIGEKLKELLEGKTFRQVLIRVSKVYKVESRETREKSSKQLEDLNISEVAFVGGSAANRLIAKVLIKTGSMKVKGNFFKKEEDAINWLKSNR